MSVLEIEVSIYPIAGSKSAIFPYCLSVCLRSTSTGIEVVESRVSQLLGSQPKIGSPQWAKRLGGRLGDRVGSCWWEDRNAHLALIQSSCSSSWVQLPTPGIAIWCTESQCWQVWTSCLSVTMMAGWPGHIWGSGAVILCARLHVNDTNLAWPVPHHSLGYIPFLTSPVTHTRHKRTGRP